jgi:hypothetical protein
MPRWITRLTIACLCTGLFQLTAQAQDRQALIDIISESPDWTIQDEPQHFVDGTVGDILGDENDPAHDFEVVGISEFGVTAQESGNTVEVTLFEMFDSTAAFGLFALERNHRAPDFAPAIAGNESYRQDGRLVLWQANYIAMLGGPVEDTDSVGRVLVNNIFGSSRKAPVSTFLPREGLIADSEKYILTPDAFEQITGMSSDNLGFENSVEAVVAEYASPGGGTMLMAMLLYPTQHLASVQLDTWLEERTTQQLHQRSGPLLAITVDTNDNALTESILDTLRYESEVTWNEPPPDPLTLPYMILTIFSWIGIALGFTLVVGLGYGGLRIYMKTRYPDRFLGSSPGTELVQLKLDQPVTVKQLSK